MIDRLQSDLEVALRTRDNVKAQVLREALASCKREALLQGIRPESLSSADAAAILGGMVRNRKERIEHRGLEDSVDWVARDLSEIAILQNYLGSQPVPHRDEKEPFIVNGLRRFHRRVNVGPDYTLQFFLQGEEFRGIRITNLSTDGCCVQLGAELAELVRKGSRVHNLVLNHPGLPDAPQLAEVIYLLGKQTILRHPEKGLGFVLAGLQFVHPTGDFQERLSLHVTEKLKAEETSAGNDPLERIPRCKVKTNAHERVDVGADHTVRFFLLDQEFRDVRISNLSAGGCCLQLDPEVAELLRKGDRLHNLSLCHSDLPGTPQHGEVVYLLNREEILKRVGKEREPVRTGIKFLNPNPVFQEQVSRYVRARLREAGEGNLGA